MLFQICQVNGLSAQKVFADTGFRHVTVNNDVVLGGNYIEVGVSKAGSFGTASAAPSGFHQTCGGIGLSVDGDGFDTGNPPTTGDFFLPGTPEESFTVGYRVGSEGAAPTKYTNAERMDEAGISTVTTDTTADDTLSATTSGTTSDNNLDIKQKVSFKVNDKFFKNTITYTNKGTSTLYDVRYMRSVDPDQDEVLNSSFETYNCVLENFPQDSRAIVRATGAVTKEPIFLISTDSRARASSFGFDSEGEYGFKNRDPYDPNAYNIDGSILKTPETLVDKAIAITFSLGNLEPGQSTTFQYYTSLDPNYSDGLAAIMGSLGLKINDGAAATSSTDVTLNLSADNAVQMQFSNDCTTWSAWEPYASTKSWKLTDGDGTKTVYVQFKDNADNISCTSASITYDTASPIITSVSGNPTSWTNNDVTLTVNASDTGSGLNAEGAYSFNGGSWTTENSKSFSENGTVNIRVRDNLGNIISQDVIINKIDKAAPTITSVTVNPSDWTKNDVTLTVNASDALSGLADKAYSFDGGNNWQTGNTKTYTENTSNIVVKVKDAVGNITAHSLINAKIDRISPKFSGASDASSYYVGRVIKITDDLGEIAGAAYKKDAADEISFMDGTLFEKAGKYELTVEDKAGNSAELSFEIKAMPEVEDIVYTEDCKALIESIRAEFNSHNDLPEPYKTNMDNKIKSLEMRYSELDKEVNDIKSETSIIKGKVDILPDGTDGLLNLQNEIQDEYNKIAGDTYTLTKEQKAALENEALYLKQQLDIITNLQNQINNIKTNVSDIDTNVDGLISKEDKIKELLGDINKLTKEQQSILQPQIDLLNSLSDKINTLKEEVQAVKDMINKLPSVMKITKEDMDLLTNVNNVYNKLTNEQKSLVGEYSVKYLNDCLDALRKLMLHDDPNDITITGIEGTTFASNVYLIVTPYKADSTCTEFTDSAASVKNAAGIISEITGKELVALYDVSLFKDNVKIQPDGKVKVKIKVPENLIGRAGLDIVHIADDGTVTSMHAVEEDGYLVFTTTHFSNYGIVAQPIAKSLPKTGSAVDSNLLLVGGVLFIIAGLVVIKRQRRKKFKGIV